MKMKFIDIAVSVVFVLAIIVIYFFWGCKWDIYATILAVIIFVVTGIVRYKQYKEIKELMVEKEEMYK